MMAAAVAVGMLLRAAGQNVSRRLAGNDTAVDDESANESASQQPRTRFWVEAGTAVLLTLGTIALTREADFSVTAAVVTLWFVILLLCGLLPWDRSGRVREPKRISWFGTHR